MKLVHVGLITLLGLAGGARFSARADEWATWQALNLKYLDTRRVDLVFYGDLRSNLDPAHFGGFLASQQVKFDLLPNLTAGVNYTFLSLPTKNSNELIETHRAEVELVPHFKVADWLEVTARQRLELPWTEGHGGPTERTRHRLFLDFPLRHAGPLHSVFLGNELFYDFTQHRVTENRLVPGGLNFQITKKSNFSLFYTEQRIHSGNGWYDRHILNTLWSVTL